MKSLIKTQRKKRNHTGWTLLLGGRTAARTAGAQRSGIKYSSKSTSPLWKIEIISIMSSLCPREFSVCIWQLLSVQSSSWEHFQTVLLPISHSKQTLLHHVHDNPNNLCAVWGNDAVCSSFLSNSQTVCSRWLLHSEPGSGRGLFLIIIAVGFSVEDLCWGT